MLATIALPLVAFLSLASAQYTCDANSAMTTDQFISAMNDLSTASESGAGSSCDIYPSCPDCAQDPTFEICRSWHQTQLQDELNANMLNGAYSFGGYKRTFQPRSTSLECTDTQVCVAATDDFYWCIEPSSLDFADSNGGSGNLDSNTYTMSNGEVTEVASTATALPTPTASGSRSTGTAAEAANRASSTASTSASSGSSDTSSAASSKMDGFRGVALMVVGAVGLLL